MCLLIIDFNKILTTINRIAKLTIGIALGSFQIIIANTNRIKGKIKPERTTTPRIKTRILVESIRIESVAKFKGTTSWRSIFLILKSKRGIRRKVEGKREKFRSYEFGIWIERERANRGGEWKITPDLSSRKWIVGG